MQKKTVWIKVGKRWWPCKSFKTVRYMRKACMRKNIPFRIMVMKADETWLQGPHDSIFSILETAGEQDTSD